MIIPNYGDGYDPTETLKFEAEGTARGTSGYDLCGDVELMAGLTSIIATMPPSEGYRSNNAIAWVGPSRYSVVHPNKLG